MKNKYRLISFWVVSFLIILSFLIVLERNEYFNNENISTSSSHLSINFLDKFGNFELERTDGGYFTFIDKDTGREIDQTARHVYIGDQLILSDNSLYEVEKIEGDEVFCRFIRKEEIAIKEMAVLANQKDLLAQGGNGSVAIYSTHTAESYVPTSGTDSRPGNGDILEVSEVIGNVLKKQGINTFVSKNAHDPHDANAYQRSRRTAVQLLKNRPVTIIDVHRDGVPDPQFYSRKIDGNDATQIRLVVGRQNQNMQANLDYAKQMKAYYDQHKPGLVKAIFIAKGNYNQDLAPRSILIEVGTHTNSLQAANNGASSFASLLPGFLGLSGTTQPKTSIEEPAPTGGRGVGTSILWILLLFTLGTAGFLFISTGSLQGSWDKVKGFGKEFTSYLGNLKRKNK
ncbi:MAG: stage II sporulation protein P [Peptococcales bacterium]|jgi:stage II sporulation protein P